MALNTIFAPVLEIDLIEVDLAFENTEEDPPVEIITMPNRLKYLVGSGGFDTIKIDKAKSIFIEERSKFEMESRAKLATISTLIDKAEKAKCPNEQHDILVEMRSLTLAFQTCSGFSLQDDLYKISNSFLPFITSVKELNGLSLAICKIFQMSIISSASKQTIKGVSHKRLTKLLSQACNCYLKSQKYGTYRILEENFGFLRGLAPIAAQYEWDGSQR